MSRLLLSRMWVIASLVGLFLTLTSCAQMIASLRNDLDEPDPYTSAPPTTGGRYAGSGFMANDYPEGGSRGDRYSSGGRGLASDGATSARGGWVSSEQEAANRRDAARGDDQGPTADSNPVLAPPVQRQYKNGSRATRDDFVDQSQNEGSLWASDGQTNYYFTKNKIRNRGDIITVTMEQDLVRDISIEARRSLSQREREFEMEAAQERLKLKAYGQEPDAKNKDQVASSAAAPATAAGGAAADKKAKIEPKEVEVPVATVADVDVGKSLELKAGDTMLGEIVDRYPNGAYRIRATKRIPYKGGPPRNVSIEAVVKGTDIAEDDTVASGKLYEYRTDVRR